MRRNGRIDHGRRLRAVLGIVALGAIASVVSDVPPVGAATCDDGEAAAFVCRAHASFARRPATSAEIDLWVPQLPARRTSFIATVARGAESRHETVIAYFDRFAGLVPTAADHGYWDDESLTPTGLRRLEAALLANDGTSDVEMVDIAYDLYLDRAPSDGDRAYWVDRIGQTGRNRVAADIAHSPEARRLRVVAAFQNELLRTPDANSRDYWAERLRTGTSYLDLRIALRSTPDGYRRSGAACAPSAPQTDRICP